MTIQLLCLILLANDWLQFQRFSIPGLAGYPFVNVKSENNVGPLANLICRMVQLFSFSLPLSSFRHQHWFWPVLSSSSILGVLPTSFVIPKPQLSQAKIKPPFHLFNYFLHPICILHSPLELIQNSYTGQPP